HDCRSVAITPAHAANPAVRPSVCGSSGPGVTAPQSPTTILVVGAGGLLGAAVGRAAARRDEQVLAARVCWKDPTTAGADLRRAHLTRNSLSVYVPLDTIRDYLFVDDCADMICDALAGAADSAEPAIPLVKILAAHQGVTIGTLLGEFRRVFKRIPLVVLG